MLDEKYTGIYTRSLIAGTGPIKMIIGNCIQSGTFAVLQTLLWILALGFLQGVNIKGSYFLLLLLGGGMAIFGELFGK